MYNRRLKIDRLAKMGAIAKEASIVPTGLPPTIKTKCDFSTPTTAIPPLVPTCNFGIELPKPKKPEMPRDLSSEECQAMFGKHEAVYMNFIPQMLTALALEQAEEFIKYCRDNRLSEYKKHNREMRKCIDEYNYELRQSYGQAWFAYEGYLNRLREYVSLDLFKTYCTFSNEASKQYIGRPHKDIPARVTFVRMLLTFIEEFDRNIDKVISARLNKPCHRRENGFIVLISVLCIDIAETFSHKMDVTPNMALCVKVLANRCREVAKQIISDEEVEAGSN